MRVCLVIDNLAWGGAQRQIAVLAAGLHRRGHEVDLFLYYPGYDHVDSLVRSAGVRVVEAHKRGRIGIPVFRALADHLRRMRAEVVAGFMPTPASYAALSARLAGGIPVVAAERESFRPGRISLDARLRRQPYRLATHVTTNSHYQRERLAEIFPWLRGRLSTIWNGVDIDRYRPRADAHGSPEPEGPLRLLGVGSIVPVKNVEALAQALVVGARSGGPAATVEWAGAVFDDPESHAIVARIDRLLAGHGLHERWKWLGLRHDVEELYREADALVHPSWTEGLPNAVCEALAAGLPVLASDAADHPLLVGDGERGLLFDAADASTLAGAIARFATLGPAGRAAMGARARAFAERSLSREVYLDRYEELLQRLVAERGRLRGASAER